MHEGLPKAFSRLNTPSCLSLSPQQRGSSPLSTSVASCGLAPEGSDPFGGGAAEGSGAAVLEAGTLLGVQVISLTLQLEQRNH